MARIDQANREIHLKLAYMGPGLSGRSTTLKYIHSRTQGDHSKVEWVPGPDETSVLGFNFRPEALGKIRGFATRFHLIAAPGQQWHEHGRRACLEGCDAVVFVADSQVSRLDANLEAMESLAENLGPRLAHTPIILQLNKRDLPTALPVDELRRVLDPQGRHPAFESVAVSGPGCFEALKQAAKGCMLALKRGDQSSA